MKFLGFDIRRAVEEPAEKLLTPPRKSAGAVPLAAVLAGLGEGLLAVDKKGKVLLCNEALAPLVSGSPSEAAGHTLWEILRHREVGEMMARVLETGRGETREVTFSLPQESIWQVRAVGFPMGESPEGVVFGFTDFTTIRRLENLRKDFVANVSHELKTPLTSLKASLETLLDGALEDPRHAREFLETAQTQVNRLHRLIEDLLALSRLENTEALLPSGNCAVRATAEKALAALRPLAAKKNVTMESHYSSENLTAALPADELTQILMNLLDNAVKFNKEGGDVALSVQKKGAGLEIQVKDTGMGIPFEDQKRIFERFYRVDKARSREMGGTGLGLSIVKHIVETRKGSVSLESVPDQGSSFKVFLPSA